MAISSIRKAIEYAESELMRSAYDGDEWSTPEWYIESCFLQLLGIYEAVGLVEMRKDVYADYLGIKNGKNGFGHTESDPNDDPYSPVLSRIRQYLSVVGAFYKQENSLEISKDLETILRNMTYTITDARLFREAPRDEADVHLRIEGILKTIFPDLKHKPVLTKPIKNFEPDTGIPSLDTLIEYKFLDSARAVPRIADEMLADTRGYASTEWKRFIYVVYETHRFKSEKEWKHLFIKSDVSSNSKVIVISGEPPKSRRKRTAVVRK